MMNDEQNTTRLSVHRLAFTLPRFSERYLAEIYSPYSNSRPGLSIVNSTVRVDHKRSDLSKGRCGQRPCLRGSSRKPASGAFGLPTLGKHVCGTPGVLRSRRSCDPCERDSISSHIHFWPHDARAAFLVGARTPDSETCCHGSCLKRPVSRKPYTYLSDHPPFAGAYRSCQSAE